MATFIKSEKKQSSLPFWSGVSGKPARHSILLRAMNKVRNWIVNKLGDFYIPSLRESLSKSDK